MVTVSVLVFICVFIKEYLILSSFPTAAINMKGSLVVQTFEQRYDLVSNVYKVNETESASIVTMAYFFASSPRHNGRISITPATWCRVKQLSP
jgi:hypothetical protein